VLRWAQREEGAPVGQARVGTASGGRRVPAEHRLFGIDKRTIPFAAAAAAVWLLWAVVFPQIDERVAWNDTIRAGERIQVSDDVTFAPAEGWGLLRGLRTTDVTDSGQRFLTQTVLTNDGISFYVQTGDWDGTPRALLNQITKITNTETRSEGFQVSTRPTTIQTATGMDGVLEGFRSPRAEGLIAAFVVGGQGIKVQAVGPTEQLGQHTQEIGRMISSFRTEAPAR
jgi:hypothetical protein